MLETYRKYVGKKMIENQYIIVLWGVRYRQKMSETLSVTMSETSRVVKRYLAVMQKVGILRHEDKGNVGVCCLLAKLAFR